MPRWQYFHLGLPPTADLRVKQTIIFERPFGLARPRRYPANSATAKLRLPRVPTDFDI